MIEASTGQTQESDLPRTTISAPRLHLRLAEALEVEREGQSAFHLALRDAALLAWLAVEGPTPRARLAALFWPTSSDIQARATLRQRLFKLKKSVGADVVEGATILRLAEGISHDLAGAAVFLAACRLPEAPEVDAWLGSQQQQRNQGKVEALSEQATALQGAGDIAAALAAARDLLRLDPLSELAHQRLIRLLYLAGDRAAALAAFDAWEQLLKNELGARPSPDTLALLATVEQAAAPHRAGSLQSLPAAVLRPPRMVGRDAESAALRTAWGSHHIVAVIGEAGMGKTRLLADFTQGLMGIVRSAGRPGDGAVPFATLARLLRVAGAGRASTLEPQQRLQVARVLPELGTAGAPFPEGQRLQLQQAIRAHLLTLQGLQGLVLDDLHHADEASLDLLQALLPDLQALRCAVAYRPAEAGSPLMMLEAALAESAMLVQIAIEPLDTTALAALVEELALGLDGAALAPELLQRTGGNPLFVLETLKQAWVEQGIERLARGGPLPRAASVEQLIRRRVSQLSPDALALARVASLAGTDFRLELAEHVLQRGAIYLVDALNELDSAQVMKDLQFAHDLVLDGVRRDIPVAVAAVIHGKVAQWLEQQGGEPARIARHWIAAKRPTLAIPWLAQAADMARTALRNADRVAFLDEKEAIESANGLRADAFSSGLKALEAAMGATYDVELLRSRFERLQSLALFPEERIRLALNLVQLQMHRRENEAALDSAQEALRLARQWGDAQWTGRCEVALLEQLVQAERLDAALAQSKVCEPWAATTDDVETLARYWYIVATAQERTGQIDSARAAHERALALCERLGQFENQSVSANNLAVNRREAGELRLAIQFGLQALQLASRYETMQAGTGPTCVNLTEACAQLGRYTEALRWADEAQRRLTLSIPAAVPLVQAHRAAIYLQLGQPARTRQLLAQIRQEPAAILPARVRLHVLAARLARADGLPAEAELLAGLDLVGSGGRAGLRAALQLEQSVDLPVTAALELLAMVRTLAAQHGRRGQVLEAHVRAAPLAATLNPALALHHVEQALALAEEVDLVGIYRGELWLHGGRSLLAIGEPQRADELVRLGAEWVARTAATDVPEAFRDSFLHRNPTNVSLLGWHFAHR